MDVQTPLPRYMQIARHLVDAIQTGQYEPGDLLPSESQMIKAYGVSQTTVRQAVAELRAMGLAHSQHGKGTIVRGNTLPPMVYDRSIQRAGKSWLLPFSPEAEPPAVTRIILDGPAAELLRQPDHDAISVDRTILYAETGTRMAHRMIIPLSVAAEVPSLADAPHAPVSDLYRQLSDAGHDLTFHDEITARTPYPDERAALNLTDASPLLVTYRVTHGNNRPLLCEELKTPAIRCRLTYPVTPTNAATNHPRQQRSA